MNIGDKVKVKFHPTKEFEKEPYKIKSIYLNDYICQPWNNPRVSCRAINKDMAESWQ